MEIATSLNAYDQTGAQVEEMVDRAVEVGFTALDFNYVRSCPITNSIWDRPLDEQLKLATAWGKKAQEAGAPFRQMHGPLYDPFASPDEVEKGNQRAMNSFAIAATLGARWVVLHAGTARGTDASPQRQRLQLERNVDHFAPLVRRAGELGVGIAIENGTDKPGGRRVARSFCAIPEEQVALVDALAEAESAEAVGACWDTGHAHLQGLPQAESLQTLGHRIKAVHIQDNDGKSDQHLVPYAVGPDSIDWVDVMKGLRAIDFRGPFTYEAHNGLEYTPNHLLDDLLRYSVRVAQHILTL